LAQQAPLLVLDEPTAGLDPAQALGVCDVLTTQAAQGRAVLFSTHDIGLAVRVAHRVLLMREGRTIAAGSVDVLTPEALEAAYGRKASVQRVNDTPIVAFE
jgi:iron complex transport system ATP-binding protein